MGNLNIGEITMKNIKISTNPTTQVLKFPYKTEF